MSHHTRIRHTAFAVLGAAALSLTGVLPGAAAGNDRPELPPVDTTISTSPQARTITGDVDTDTLRTMARSSGRSVTAQRNRLDEQAEANNAYATLVDQGMDFDGAFFTDGTTLTVQAAAGSDEAEAATEAGLEVRSVTHGEAQLQAIQAELDALDTSRDGIASYGPDIVADKLVVTVTGQDIDRAFLRAARGYGSAVKVVRGQPNQVTATVLAGDEITIDRRGRCSAGFPATTSSGTRVMIWAGHCNENGSSFYNRAGTRVATNAASAFISYDGRPDRDIGALYMDSGDTMSTSSQRWGTSGLIGNAPNGAWKAPVGTELCKSGRTTGVTCGTVQGWNQTVTYSDNQGRTQAVVSGLGQTSVCVEGGDSGGAYIAQGYAVAMTSGGPGVQSCRYNGGFQRGSSYVQPVTDALSYYGLQYG